MSAAERDAVDVQNVLRAVATYRLMSRDMLRRAGAAKDPKRITHALRLMERHKWIKQTVAERRGGARPTRTESLIYLTNLGAEAAGQLGLEVKGSRRTLRTEREVEHRLAIVETHIALRQWAGEALAWFVSDFEPGSFGRMKATTIESGPHRFMPDALAELHPHGQPPQFLVLEVERGGARGDVWRVTREKIPHWRAIAEAELVEGHFQAEDLARFLIVTETEEMRAKVLERWDDPTAEVWGRFFVKSLPELAADFAAGWWQPGRPRAALL